ncbi:MAG TPA: aromatic ring-hydroxylating dioxygenase subunit alpha, partial [Chloroflexota bacterium]|nr:aromatic ring-hydroxylating dioxygenase subunit alpha [Chloroflexota bacterium]
GLAAPLALAGAGFADPATDAAGELAGAEEEAAGAAALPQATSTRVKMAGRTTRTRTLITIASHYSAPGRRYDASVEIESLVRDDPERGIFRVHRSTMTSPDVFRLEQERIFDHSWLYLAHESELREPGDYHRRTIAGRPLFIVRGRDGQVRAFLNSCTHRGALVCRHEQGNAESFQCFYHGWTFNNQGQLIGIPDQAAYSECFDRAERGLMAVPRLDSYRGMYFVSFDPEVTSLVSYLGDLREYIDQTMDCAEPLGGWHIVGGSARYTIRANWKLLVENSMDDYHLATVHQTYIEYMDRRLAAFGSSRAKLSGATRGLTFPGGHGGFLRSGPGRTTANSSPLWSEQAKQQVAALRQQLIERHGEDRGREMADRSRHLLIYPNLMFQDSPTGMRFRIIWPIAADTLDVLQTDLVPHDESPELRAYRHEGSRAFLGPGGLATPDDVEALEACQAGFAADPHAWSDLSRGMHRSPQSNDEIQMRSFWRQWRRLMMGRTGMSGAMDRGQKMHNGGSDATTQG